MYVLMGGTQTRVEGLKPDVIILSGGPNSVHVDGAPTVRSFRPSHHHACTYLSIRLRRTRRRRKHHLIAAREKRAARPLNAARADRGDAEQPVVDA